MLDEKEYKNPKDIPLYRYSLDSARHSGEVREWRISHHANISCARDIAAAINRDFKDMILDKNCAKSVIDKYGFDRVNYVLQNNLQQMSYDGRFSQRNKDWGNQVYIDESNLRPEYIIRTHPAILDGFINEAREEWNKLGLFDLNHCIDPDSEGAGLYEGKVLVLSPRVLKDEYKTPDDQLFYATGGFGCYPDKLGTKVFGYFLKDGEQTSWTRSSFLGVINDEYLPDWAREKLSETQDSGLDDQSEDDGGMTMS